MSRFAYIWIIAAVAFSFWFHAHEEAERRSDISTATSHTLYVGSMAGCRSNNRIIDEIAAVADKLHPSQKAAVEKVLTRDNCRQRAHRIVVTYQELAAH